MSFSKYFWKGYNLIKDPNKTYQKGWQDAINGLPRHQYRLALLIDNYIETQKLSDKGYDDGLKERLINKF